MARVLPGGISIKPLTRPEQTRSRYDLNQQGIPTPNPLIKRYPNGVLDVRGTVGSIVNIIKRVKDYSRGGYGSGPLLMPVEKALLSLVLPIPNVDPRFINISSKLTGEELSAIREGVNSSLGELKSYAAGRGRGSTPGSKFSVDI